MRFVVFFFLFAPALAAQTLPVTLQKRFWPDTRGEIRITQEGIGFQETNGKTSHTWAYRDIQAFDRWSRTEFVILSYEDQRWKLGRDRRYHFALTAGELTDELFERIRQGLAKPVTDRVVREVSAAVYELPVKHRHSFGGCEGLLLFTPEAIYYQTEQAEDARAWRWATDVESIWSSQPYELEVHVYEDNRREFSRTRVFKFALKKPLDPEFYRNLKLKLYELGSSRSGIP